MNKYITMQISMAICACLLIAGSLRQPGTAQSRKAEAGGSSPPTKAIIFKAKGYVPQSISGESKKGEACYAQAHCSACHSIANEGGAVGPMLDGVGSRRDTTFMFDRLANTTEDIASFAKLTGQKVDNLPPHVRLSPEMTKSVVAFLKTIPEPAGGFAVSAHHSTISEEPKIKIDFQPDPQSSTSEAGKKLYQKFACAQCHQIQQVGGFIGPSLDGIGSFHNREYLAAQITDAQAQALTSDKFFELVPTSMPKFDVTSEQAKQITDYLMTLPK